MTFLNIALTGVFIWSGLGGVAATTPSQASPMEIAPVELISVKLTGYNAVPEQTDGDPHITASGARSNPEVIAARSRDLAESLPYGTIIALDAPKEKTFSCGFKSIEHLVGYRVIADVTHARKEKQIDILFDPANTVLVGGKVVNPAIANGVCEVTIRVVGKILVKDIPATQAELAKMINGSHLAVK